MRDEEARDAAVQTQDVVDATRELAARAVAAKGRDRQPARMRRAFKPAGESAEEARQRHVSRKAANRERLPVLDHGGRSIVGHELWVVCELGWRLARAVHVPCAKESQR